MTVQDTIDLLNNKCELRFLKQQVIKQFGLSKMPHMDAINNAEFPARIVFVEFLELLGRLSFELFKDHDKMKDEPLHIKYDAFLTKMFNLIKFQKVYTYLDITRANVAYEVVLNPQLGKLEIGGIEKAPTNMEKMNSDLEKLGINSNSGTLKFNM